jgi:hypothetical protein
MVFQWPKGALPGRRAPLGAQPLSGAMLVVVQVSSMKTSRPSPSARDCQEFRAGLGMIGAKELDDATPQRTSHS